MDFKTALVLAPHIDDETLGCGGIIQRFDTKAIAFSHCGLGAKEFYEACSTLMIVGNALHFTHREFDRDRQRILDEMLKQEVPDVVFCPASFDCHQDHQVIHNEAVRAFKGKCTILGYAHPWNIVNKSDFRMKAVLTEEEHDKKLDAMDCYKSQQHREYFNYTNWIKSYEQYEVIQWMF